MPVGCVVVAFAGCVKAWIVRAGGAGYGEFVDACGRRAADTEARDRPAVRHCVCGSFGDRACCGEGDQSHKGGGFELHVFDLLCLMQRQLGEPIGYVRELIDVMGVLSY